MFEKVTQKLTQSVCSNDGESLLIFSQIMEFIMMTYMDLLKEKKISNLC